MSIPPSAPSSTSRRSLGVRLRSRNSTSSPRTRHRPLRTRYPTSRRRISSRTRSPSRVASSFSSSHSASSRRLTAPRFGEAGRPLQAGASHGGPCAPARPRIEPDRRARTMIKSILVALDGSQHADSALEHALWLARRLQARLIGLHVLDIVSIEGSFLHDVSGSLGFEPYLDFSSKMREALQERGRVLLDAFTARCETEGIAHDTALPMGIVANEICDQARTADLVVVGHRGVNEQFSTGLLGATTESVARKSPKPVLVSPMQFQEIRRPLLAYDGSQRASAAMHAAAELVSALGLPLTVVHVAREGVTRDDKILEEARRYLQAYGLELNCVTISGPPHQRIVDMLRDRGYDLLFIGAYGHSKIIEMVLGSTTEYVLRNSPCPVFLAR